MVRKLMRSAVRLWAIAAAALAVSLLLPATNAVAGRYDVYSCRIPYGVHAGDPAPVEVAPEGVETAGEWSRIVTGGARSAQSCGTGGELAAALPGGTPHTEADASTWQFAAPTEEKIVGATLWRAGDADGGSGYLYWLASPGNPEATKAAASEDFFDGCIYTLNCRGVGTTAEPLAKQNELKVLSEYLGGTHIYFNAGCSKVECPSSPGDSEHYAAVVYVYATDLVLEQSSVPSVSGLSGALDTATSVSGEASLDFQASDSGSGVYQAIVKIDGAVVSEGVVDEEEGRCRTVESGPDGLPAFLHAQPCPSSVTGHLSLDTSKLSNGEHALSVTITDAAGNRTTALQRRIDVANATGSPGGGAPGAGAKGTPGAGAPGAGMAGGSTPPAGNGVNASAMARLAVRWVRTGKRPGRRAHAKSGATRALGSRFGVRHTIAGRLTAPSGLPIEDATVTVTARPLYGGSNSVEMKHAITARNGRFVVHLANRSPSQTITLSYAPTMGSPGAISRTLTLRVHAGVRLRITPRRTSAGHVIRLSGRVLGRPIPAGGKQVVLEARSKGSSWLQFDVVQTNRLGLFHAEHHFRLPGPMRYEFRAVSPHEADFPFLTGGSNIVRVWES